MKNGLLSEQEKLAIKENPNAEIILGTNGETVLNEKKAKDRDRFNEQVDTFTKRFDEHSKQMEEFAEKVSDKLNGLEIMPVYAYILVEPFKENPFQRIKKTDSGLLITNGFAPQYKSEEDGKWHEEESFVTVASVVEVGPTCEFVKPGDLIMYPTKADITVPFYNTGFRLVHEQRVMCVINEGLTDRKNNIKNGNKL